LVSVWERERERILNPCNSFILFFSFAVYTDGECEGKLSLSLSKKAVAQVGV
jgi:hypothetical protein